MRPCGNLKGFILALVIPCVALVSGCKWFSESAVVSVEISKDCFPWEPYLPASGYRAIYPDPDNPGEKEILTVSAGTTTFGLRIPKGSAVPVAVYLASGGKPSGGIFPQTLSEGMHLGVSPENGFLAELLLSLLPERERMESVNVSRLMGVIRDKGGGNPWSIDPELLKLSLFLGSMAEYRIRQQETAVYEIKDMPGSWIPGDPFLKEASSGPSGLLTLTLFPGINSYLNRDSGDRLYVDVGKDTAEYIVVTGEDILEIKTPAFPPGHSN